MTVKWLNYQLNKNKCSLTNDFWLSVLTLAHFMSGHNPIHIHVLKNMHSSIYIMCSGYKDGILCEPKSIVKFIEGYIGQSMGGCARNAYDR